jgi:UDP-N-acetylmuramyl tripeptide synthase
MSISLVISLIIAKILARFGGTALPGLVGLTLTPTLINQIIKKNKIKSIIITGTNGKTSTAKLLSAVLSDKKIAFIHNHSGSNLMRGIATSLINQINIFGKTNKKLAIFEVDEASVLAAVNALNPKIIVILNLSRDQLDRYGEVDRLFNQWQLALQRLPASTRVLVNRADRRLRRLRHPGKLNFGSAIAGRGLAYPPAFAGMFNRDSLWAVIALGRLLGFSSNQVKTVACKTPPAFGRGEVLHRDGACYQINLIKNPASFQAIWQMLLSRGNLNQPLLLILNDGVADGRDISWIYDVRLKRLHLRKTPVVVSGRRSAELALRLKYAGLDPNLLIIESKLKQAFRHFAALPGKNKFILPTYTAMLQLRRFLGLKPWI